MRTDAQQVGQFAAGDEEDLAARAPQPDERLDSRLGDQAVMGEGAVVVGGKADDVHEEPPEPERRSQAGSSASGRVPSGIGLTTINRCGPSAL